MQVKNLHAASPRFPTQRYSASGKSAPKARAKAVVDGKQINISVLHIIAMGGRRRLSERGVGCPRESM